MNKVKVGISRVCITPPLGTSMSGYFEARYCNQVLDDLYATAVAFDDGERRAVVVACDLCDLKDEQWMKDCLNMVSDFCHIPAQAVMFTCSHTHTGPSVGFDVIANAPSNPVYDAFLMQRMRDVVYLALSDVRPARFYAAKTEVKDIAFCRTFRMKDGSVKTNPGIQNPDILAPLSEVNQMATVVKMVREDAEDILLVNFGVHADVIAGCAISADFPGVMRKRLEQMHPGTMSVFLQGAEGDVNHIDVRGMDEDKNPRYVYMGMTLANAVNAVLDNMTEFAADEICMSVKKLDIPANKENHRLEEAYRVHELHKKGYKDEELAEKSGIRMTGPEASRIIRLKDAPDLMPYWLYAIRVGEMVFAGLPGEPFGEIGKRIIDGSPYDTTLVCVLTNNDEVYFPTGDIYDERAYEAVSSFVKKGTDDMLVEGMIALFDEVK
ncbi:MAG: hypothetical protein E7409_07260 [Ruminococcaceae bacterium]|nr:hypothetical protein [Oscillospiraceae bacterium]